MKLTFSLLFFLLAISASGQVIETSIKEGCVPFSSTFTYSGPEAASYSWTFGNGQTSSAESPTILFDKAGNYQVSLNIMTTLNQSVTINLSDPIIAKNKPEVDFKTDDTKVCAYEPIACVNNSKDAPRFLWDFGDGTSSTAINPTHIYERGGKYSVILVAYNEIDCSEILVKNDVIEIIEAPTLEILTDQKSACLDNPTIAFSTSSAYSSYLWDFGDGNSSISARPIHTYNNGGNYQVSLTVTSANGCTLTKGLKDPIQIHQLPQAQLSFSDDKVCAGGTINFSGDFQESQNIVWTFSDGYTTEEKTFDRDFQSVGKYDVTASITSAEGCTQIIHQENAIEVIQTASPNIDLGVREGCAPFNVSFTNATAGVSETIWEVNGITLNGENVSTLLTKAGIYDVNVTLLYASGCSETISYDSAIVVNEQQVTILSSAETGCRNTTVQFELSTSEISGVTWEFGTLSTASGNSVEYTFNEPGNHIIKASFTNKFGCKQDVELSDPIRIYPDTIAYSRPERIVSCQSAEVFFDGSMGSDFWHWDFGDGNTSQITNPTHFFANPGRYQVSLITNNEYGCETTISNYNEIIVSDIEASFTQTVMDTSKACPDYTMQFQSTVTNAVKYLWEFGTAETSEEPNPIIDINANSTSVNLTVWDQYGCSSTITRFTSSPRKGCASDTIPPSDYTDPSDSISISQRNVRVCDITAGINFPNLAPEAESWLWNFGDGTTSNTYEPEHYYENSGTYFVQLIAYYSDGSIDSLDHSRVEAGKPSANYSATQEFTCLGTEVQYTSPKGSIQSWEWNFGTGDTSLEASPIYTYSKPGIYQVSLIVTDSSGCQSKVIKNVSVGNPYYNFEFQDNLCKTDPLEIDHNLAGFDSYEWNFGDGNTSNDKYPKHSYSQPGVYSISITASATSGCSQTFSMDKKITVNHPIAKFEADKIYGCNALDVAFSNKSEGAQSFQWYFGNSEASQLPEPKASFGVGMYDITLVASKNGCSDTTQVQHYIKVDSLAANFTFTQEQACLPVNVQFNDESVGAAEWLWDFGNGNTSTEKNPAYTFTTYVESVQLEITNANGCKSSKTIALEPLLNVDFNPAKAQACVGEDILFENTSNHGLAWFWDFGDGNTSTDESPTHAYMKVGSYSVKLMATSPDGCESSVIKENVVEIKSVTAGFDVTVSETSCAPLLATFENLSTGAESYIWSFGDGSSSTLASPFHIFTQASEYDVSLIAKNSVGCSDTLLVEKLVTATGPKSSISVSDSVVCHPESIQFKDVQSSATSWEWIFGDGNRSTLKDPVHQYTDPGIYNVSLLATDSDGCQQHLFYDSIKVISTPKAEFELTELTSCIPAVGKITNTSSGLQNASFSWDFGNNTGSNAHEPNLRYNESGNYSLSLTVTNEGLCSDTQTFSETIVVYDTTYLSEPDVLQLSVEHNEQVSLKSSPYQLNNFKYNVVYRKKNDEASFIAFDTLWNSADVVYADADVDPIHNFYNYKIQSHVYCHAPVEIQGLNMYKSIKLEAMAQDSSIVLNWSPYEGHAFSHYVVSRRFKEGPWKNIAEVNSDQTTFTDLEELCPSVYEYQIKATHLNGGELFSASNTFTAQPNFNVFKNQTVEIIRSSVEANSAVFTEWKAPIIGPDKVSYYQIERSVNDQDYEVVAEVPKGITSFLDYEVNVNDQQYTYRIDVINVCDVQSLKSNSGSSILVQKETKEYVNTLKWNDYFGWQEGSSKYLLQRQNEYGEWKTVEVLDKDQKETTIDLSGY
ncbi:MAG: PKD domain-containing protein [Bacteroidota bacterium]